MLAPGLLVILGFALLAKGADILVEGASSIARRFHVSDMMIGLTIVAFGTSAPELTVSVSSALKGNGGIALGNVMGSNIANLGLVLGAAGLIAPIRVSPGTVWRQIPFCMATALVLLAVVTWFNHPHMILRVEGILLLALILAYVLVTRPEAKRQAAAEEAAVSRRMWLSILMIAGGLIGLVGGGELIVRNSVRIAETFGLSQQLIGVTIVAIGTSLPEVATSIAAVLKGKPDMAVGNVVGSNVLNICMVLGMASVIRPFSADQPCEADAAFVVAGTAILFCFMFTGRKHRLDRWEASVFLMLYAAYLGYAVVRG